MTAQHTPGPWTHHAEDNIITASDGRRLLEWQARSTAVGIDERDANARLIAAAPDLLAALQRFLDYETAMDSREDVDGMLIYAEFSAMARAAIARATHKEGA